jgi:hypothetical protein
MSVVAGPATAAVYMQRLSRLRLNVEDVVLARVASSVWSDSRMLDSLQPR